MKTRNITRDISPNAVDTQKIPNKNKKKSKFKVQKGKKGLKKHSFSEISRARSQIKEETNNDPIINFLIFNSENTLIKMEFEESFEINLISIKSYHLNYNGVTLENYESVMNKREKFQNYPFYLKHTLFHDDEEILSLRRMNTSEKVKICSENLEKSLNLIKQNNIAEALNLLERCLSCFKWLVFKKLDRSRDDNTLAYIDDNVILYDLIEIKDLQLRESRNNLLILIYYYISICYMKKCNYYEAITAIEEGLLLNSNIALFYYRRSQILYLNLDSYLFDLYQSKIDVFQAKEIISNEKKKIKIKKMNIDQVFQDLIEQELLDFQKKIDEKIIKRKEYEKNKIKPIMLQANDSFSKLPYYEKNKEISENQEKDENKPELMEYELILDLVGRYIRILEIYKENKDEMRFKLYHNELMDVKKVLSEMEFYLSLDFEDLEMDEVITELISELKLDISNKKLLDILNTIKKQKAQTIFKINKFNKDIFQTVLQIYMSNKPSDLTNENNIEKLNEGLLRKDVCYRILIIFILIFLFYLFNRNNSSYGKFFSENKE